MCGIVGIISHQPVAKRLVEGLKRLEYRGYDSAGIAVINDNQIQRCRAQGKIVNLDARLESHPIDGSIGIAHTRWATHGLPTEDNAHPHMTDKVAIVHNGIIENHKALRDELAARGIQCVSQTDSEVVAHLLTQFEAEGHSHLDSIFKTLAKLEGAYALGILFKDDPTRLYGTRKGSPLAIGRGTAGEMFLGSDALALAGLAEHLTYLEEGDVAVLSHDTIDIFDANQRLAHRPSQQYGGGFEHVSKGPYRHFMLKEIYEQPDVIRQTLNKYLSEDKCALNLPEFTFDSQSVSRVTIVACGTSFYAGLVAKHWIESMAHISVDVDIASEFRYRQPPLPENGVAVFISQSGETADTLAAQNYAASKNQRTIGIVNVPNSSLARAVETSLMTHAGPEIGVASTKAFSTQLCVLAVFALALAHRRGYLSDDQLQSHCHELITLPSLIEKTLTLSGSCQDIAHDLAKARDILYLGRGTSYAIALEGALKLKEISYIHAEGYAAGEMKHGPISLIDENVPIIVIAPFDGLFSKLASNVEEAAARQGQIVFISDAQGHGQYHANALARITVPDSSPLTSPFVYTLPVQLLAYYTAVHKGTDVDQPRNLAKSVTVE